MHSAGDLVVCLGDFNGHIGRHIDEFYGVHGGYGVHVYNTTCLQHYMNHVHGSWRVWCTWFKCEEKRKVIFRIEENET